MDYSYRIPTCLAFLLLFSGCYMNKAMVQPWGDEYSPDSQSDYWTPSKTALSVRTIVPLERIVPADAEPLNLAEILNIALTNNSSTQMSWARAKEMAARYGQSQSTAVPEITGNFEYFRTRASSFYAGQSAGGSATGANSGTSSGTSSNSPASANQIFVTTFSQWGPQLHLTYNLFDFGKRSATSEAARQALFFADFSHNREIQTVLQDVTTSYYTALYQKQLLDALAADVVTAQTTLDAANLGLSTGVKNLSDQLQSQTQLLQYEIDYVEQKQEVVVSVSQLLSEMGLPASLPLKLEEMPDINPKSEDIPGLEELISVAMQSRPDFLAGGAALRSKEWSVKAARREVYPSFDYLLDFGKTYYNGGLNDQYDYTSAVNLSMPIFRGYFYRNNIKIAEALRDEAEAKLKSLELQLVQEVTTARYNIEVSFDALNFARQYLASANKQYDVALSEYKAGTTDILTVVSAQSALANARARLAKSIQGWFTALADLTYAIGAAVLPPVSIQEEFP